MLTGKHISTLFATLLIAVFALSIPVRAQQKIPPPADSTMIFGTMPQPPPQPQQTYRNAWGIDLLLSTNGFGLGSFFRHEYTEDVSGYLDLSISEAQDDNEKQFVDYYGNTYSPGKVNRFLLLPVFIGIQRRLFREDIVDNFRPYINVAAGPTMIYVFPYDQEYFSALGSGQPKFTAGGYIGFGAYFGSERSNLLGMNIRYYYIPYPKGLVSLENQPLKTQFGGFYITLNFGSAW